MKSNLLYALAATAVSACALGSRAQAQIDSSSEASSLVTGGRLEEIVVTANRQQQNLQNVPIAVTAMSGGQLAAKGLTSNLALDGAVPNLSMAPRGPTVRPFLRGVGADLNSPSDEASVATYVDGVYIPNSIGNFFAFNNIARIEVLKGPQGTLFGRNATGGVIQIITRDPEQAPAIEASVGYANYQTISGELYATAGVANNLAADVAVIYEDRGKGLGENIFTGEEIFKRKNVAVRSKWLFEPSDETRIVLMVNYGRLKNDGYHQQLTPFTRGIDGVSVYPGRFNSNSEWPEYVRTRSYGAALRVEQGIGIGKLISTTAYQKVRDAPALDTDGTPLPFIQAAQVGIAKSYSQEFLLQGSAGRINWQGGVYLFRMTGDYNLQIRGTAGGPTGLSQQITHAQTESAAAFTQITYEITDSLNFTGGIRYTYDKQQINGQSNNGLGPVFVAANTSQSFRRPTFRAVLDYKPTDDILAYISYNRGMKSGGYNASSPGLPGFKPESIDAYEAGLKTTLFDRHLRFNIAAFHYNFRNLQMFTLAPNGLANITFNAGASRINGIDVDVEVTPFENLSLSGGVGFLDAKYTDFPNAPSFSSQGIRTFVDAKGNRAIVSPKFTGSSTATYTIPTTSGDFKISGTAIRKSKAFATADNLIPLPAYTMVNASLGWTSPDGHYEIKFWIQNALDARVINQRLAGGRGWLQVEGDPRTYGVKVGVKF